MTLSILYLFITIILTTVQVIRFFRTREESRPFRQTANGYAKLFVGLNIVSGLFLVAESNSPYTFLGIVIAVAIQWPIVICHISVGFRDSTRLGVGGSFFTKAEDMTSGDLQPVLHLTSTSKLVWKQHFDPVNPLPGEDMTYYDTRTVDPVEYTPLHFTIRHFSTERMKRALVAGAVGAAAWVVYSCVLFILTSPKSSELVDLLTNGVVVDMSNPVVVGSLVLSVLRASFFEEVLMRVSIQNLLHYWLRRFQSAPLLSIVFTAIIWTMGHGGVLEPEWVKLAQIFPIGVFLGYLYNRHGLESVLITHGLFNVIMVFLSPYVLPI